MKNLTLQRVVAIDVSRALTMFLMLFVNDIPGLKNIPYWLRHAEVHEDMLGFSDIIFPAFLFCMGMSVPLAIQNRYSKGDDSLQVISHIFWRTVALVTMGLFAMNSGGVENGISHQYFTLLMTIGFFLIWAIYPKAKGFKKALFIGMKLIGIALLAFLVIYKDLYGQPFHQGWWGILGLIGWTYAVCGVICLFTRNNLQRIGLIWLSVLALVLISHSGGIPKGYGMRIILLPFIPSDWTLHAFGLSGVLTTLIMQKYADHVQPKKFIVILCTIGLIMSAAAMISHNYWIVSKIQATPTWLFYCLAMLFPIFGLLYWLTDSKGKASWFNIIKPAGTATLTCYLIPPIWYSVQQILKWQYPEILKSGGIGLVRSLVFSFIIILITSLLIKIKIRLKV